MNIAMEHDLKGSNEQHDLRRTRGEPPLGSREISRLNRVHHGALLGSGFYRTSFEGRFLPEYLSPTGALRPSSPTSA